MSFGGGIALSAKIPSNDNLVKNLRANQMAGEKAKKSAEDADEKDYENLLNSVNVEVGRGKIHPIRVDDVKNTVGSFVQKATEERAKGGNWKARVQLAKAKAIGDLELLHSASQNDYDTEKSLLDMMGKGGYTEPEISQAYQALRNGDKEALSKINDKYGNVSMGVIPQSNLPMLNVTPYKRQNISKVIEDMGNNQNYQQLQGWMDAGAKGMAKPGTTVKVGEFSMPLYDEDAKKFSQAGAPQVNSLQSNLRSWLNDSSNRRSAEAVTRPILDQDETYHSLSPKEKVDYLAKTLTDQYASMIGTRKVMQTQTPFSPQRPTAAERNAASNFDVTVNYNADTKGNEVFAPSFKGAPEPKTFTVKTETVDDKGNKKVTNTDIVGVADKIEKSGDEMVLYVKDNKGVIYQTYPSASNLTAVRAQWGVSPFDVRNEANKKAGHENYQSVHPSTTGMVYGNIYKGKPQKAEGVTTPPNEKAKTKETQAKGQSISPQDEAALNWANENPNDPRAQKIFDRLAKKGIQ